ncbi:hypothetical protein ACIBHX_46250 [Nonomuraea sp. NPDC050536]|uniref:hypothetical protein n=1 Tax=Nonomuraea sp. NPDC050536 TaxID=3364366 RepID=UPI0037C75EDB
MRAATAADPAIGQLWDLDGNARFTVHEAAARALVAKSGIRQEMAAEHVADLLYGLLSPELYLLFVRDRGWSPDAWERWALQSLLDQLCAAGGKDGRGGGIASARDAHGLEPGLTSSEKVELAAAKRRIAELETELQATHRAIELVREAVPPKGGSRPSR